MMATGHSNRSGFMARPTTDADHSDATPRDRHAVSVSSSGSGEIPAGADATRIDMLHAIDGQLTELNHLIGAHHAGGAETSQTVLLTEAANNLSILRGQVETARSSVQLAALRVTMTGAVQGASTAMTAATVGTSPQQQMAAKLYDTRMTVAEHGMAEISRRSDGLFAAADARAEQLGLDIGFFRQQRTLLEAEAEAARKRGDRFGALVPQGLLAHNTANMLDEIADSTGLPEDRNKAKEGRKLAEEADRRVREAAQAEAERAAANCPFADDAARQQWIKQDAGQRFQRYQDPVAALPHAASQQQEPQATLALGKDAFSRELNDTEPSVHLQPVAAELTASLPATVRDAAKQAAQTIAPHTASAEADHAPRASDTKQESALALGLSV